MKPFTFYDIYYAPVKALGDKQAAVRRRKPVRRARAHRPESTLRLFGKRTETNGKPTGNPAPCKGERGYL